MERKFKLIIYFLFFSLLLHDFNVVYIMYTALYHAI